MSDKKKVYLAGAIGCYGYNSEIPMEWRKEAEEYFKSRSVDFVCINPTNYYEYGKEYHNTEREVMRFDMRKVKESDVILVNLADLDKSLGTSDEIIYAWLHNIPIIGFLKTKDEYMECQVQAVIHPWKYEQVDRIETGQYAMEEAIDYILNYYG